MQINSPSIKLMAKIAISQSSTFLFLWKKEEDVRSVVVLSNHICLLAYVKNVYKSSYSHGFYCIIFEWIRTNMAVSKYLYYPFLVISWFRSDNWKIIPYFFNLFLFLFLPNPFLLKGMGSLLLSSSYLICYGLAIIFISFCTISVEFENIQRKYFHVIPSCENSTFDVFLIDLCIICRIILSLSTMIKEILQSMLKVQNSLVIFMMKRKWWFQHFRTILFILRSVLPRIVNLVCFC